MFKKLYAENPNEKDIATIVEILHDGGVIIYPTDTVYGIGCDIHNHKAVERVAQIKNIKLEKANFSIICSDLSHLSDYARQVDNNTFKLMKRLLPGPYTFILNASSKVPKLFTNKKKTIGIRIPNNNIVLAIVKELGTPLLTTSVSSENDLYEEITDPELINSKYKELVDVVIDGGTGGTVLSTIIDCTGHEPIIIREGAGEIDF
jgi:tRNA threonylcarbamoyl adenosine modification protein (Sua5/YciO/YrdC/YwlC family)